MTESFAARLRADLLRQRDLTEERIPVYGRVLEWLAEAVEGELGTRLLHTWTGRAFHASYERPLLLQAGLRYDALLHGPAHPLHAAIAAEPPRIEAANANALEAAVSPERSVFYDAIARRTVQTNETSRALTWLWPSHLLARAGVTGPLSLVDLGTSAGLNLIGDGLPMIWSDADAQPLSLSPRVPVATRLGLDLAPLDVTKAEDARWLRACVWPGQPGRLARLDAAIERFTAMRNTNMGEARPEVLACPMREAPAVLAGLPDDRIVLCQQSIVRDYLQPDERAEHAAAMRRWLQARPPLRALFVELEVELEVEGNTEPLERAAVLQASFVDRTGGLRALTLARTHPHPERLFVNPDGVAAFVAAFAPS